MELQGPPCPTRWTFASEPRKPPAPAAVEVVIEELTGIDFLAGLHENKEKAIEKSKADRLWSRD